MMRRAKQGEGDDAEIVISSTGLYDLLQSFPTLEHQLGKLGDDYNFQPALGIAKFTCGKPVYTVAFETKVNAPEPIFRAIWEAAISLAANYTGLAWDNELHEFLEIQGEACPEVHQCLFLFLRKPRHKSFFLPRIRAPDHAV